MLTEYINTLLPKLIEKLRNLQYVYSNDEMPVDSTEVESTGTKSDLQDALQSNAALITQLAYYDDLALRRREEIYNFSREHYYQFSYEAAEKDIKRRQEMRALFKHAVETFE